MLTKVVVGAMAAVAVAGTGIYVAMDNSSPCGGCPQSAQAASEPTLSECGCCMTAPPIDEVTPGTEAMAACVGSAALVTAPACCPAAGTNCE